MPISKKDKEFIELVAAYFRTTRDETNPDGSIRETAEHFDINRNKVRKILITTGDIQSPITDQAMELKALGLSVVEIADRLGVSTATVSTYLPYEDVIHGSDDPSEHAAAMREYRAYERMQKERQVQAKQSSLGNQDKGHGSQERDVSLGNKDVREEREMDNRDDWKKDLDSKLSFTEADSRRQRITYEMVEESDVLDRAKSIIEASGIDIEDRDQRKELREKENLTPDEVLDLGEFPGALYDRNPYDLEEIYGEKLPYEPREMIRLHVELAADFTDDEKETMHQYGAMEGETISRDILVSDDLPLYALHYVIQRAFGFTNSHLHRFYLPDETQETLTCSVEQWMHQVGVIYRSPLMDENAEFWADDYVSGSFKNWLRKKYTGPCVSQCWDEGLIACRQSMKQVDLDREFYVEYGHYGNAEDGEAMPLHCYPVYKWNGKKNDTPKADSYVHEHRVEVVKMRDLPLQLLNQEFERGAFDLLERLPIGQVLAVHNMHCTDDFQHGEDVSTYQEMLDDGMDREIDEILTSGLDSPMKQPYVYSFTDELLYQYDFGDNWQFTITGSRNCADLVESGKITQDMLDKSNIKARVTYRPVLLARDGEMLIDDVGGASGMAEFIKAINTMHRGDIDENGMNKTQLKEWAKSQGWHRDNSTDFNLI